VWVTDRVMDEGVLFPQTRAMMRIANAKLKRSGRSVDAAKRRPLLRCVHIDLSYPISSQLIVPPYFQLGNVINGPGPIIDDDEDDDEEEQPMNVPPRMSMAMGMNQNHNIPFPTGVGSMGTQGQWGPSAATHFGNPLGNLSMHDLAHAGTGGNLGNMGMASGMNMNMNMGMGMVDPRVFMAHQQAMLIAKQTYQLAVAQQAMRDAADEWERGSAISGWGGGRSSVGTPSVLGLGMGMGLNMNNMNMNGGGGMGAGGFPGATAAAGGSLGIPNVDGMGWPIGGMAGFPAANSARPMFPGGGGGGGGLYAASEFGGSGGAGGSDRGTGWATNSVYGESFGAPRDRSSRIATRHNQASSQHMLSPGSGASSPPGAKRDGPRPRTRTAPSSGGGAGVRTSAVPVPVKKRGGEGHGLVGPVSPPSSWKGQQ
jgi:serine/arginine repetitive matrix protein 2